MNKIIKFGGIGLGILLAIYAVLRLIGWIGFYSMPTSSMSPNYPVRCKIMTIKSSHYENGDAVAVKVLSTPTSAANGQSKKEEVWMKRLMGQAGDTVLLKNGFAYVNGKLIDTDYDILLLYKMNNSNFNPKSIQTLLPDQIEMVHSGVIFLTPKQAEELNADLKLERMDLKIQDKNPDSSIQSEESWTTENWGPVVVPNGQVFILGDNRDNSMDSRSIGFISESNVLSKVVFKY